MISIQWCMYIISLWRQTERERIGGEYEPGAVWATRRQRRVKKGPAGFRSFARPSIHLLYRHYNQWPSQLFIKIPHHHYHHLKAALLNCLLPSCTAGYRQSAVLFDNKQKQRLTCNDFESVDAEGLLLNFLQGRYDTGWITAWIVPLGWPLAFSRYLNARFSFRRFRWKDDGDLKLRYFNRRIIALYVYVECKGRPCQWQNKCGVTASVRYPSTCHRLHSRYFSFCSQTRIATWFQRFPCALAKANRAYNFFILRSSFFVCMPSMTRSNIRRETHIITLSTSFIIMQVDGSVHQLSVCSCSLQTDCNELHEMYQLLSSWCSNYWCTRVTYSAHFSLLQVHNLSRSLHFVSLSLSSVVCIYIYILVRGHRFCCVYGLFFSENTPPFFNTLLSACFQNLTTYTVVLVTSL